MPAAGHRPPSEPEALRLDERVLGTLQGLSGRLAFSGLRRVLGTHPESLARSLRRLEREGLVERIDGGYRALTEPPSVGPPGEGDLRAIAQIDLPPTCPPDELLGRLAGRWFGTLRWVGLLERDDGELLAWARRDGGALVLLGLRGGVLRVYASVAGSSLDPADSEEAAYELLYHAVEALRPSPGTTPGAPVRAFVLGTTALPVEN
jgi:DNA-binding Lrp family transcriptional regulator